MSIRTAAALFRWRLDSTPAIRAFTSAATTFEKALPPRRKIDENEITESFLRGTGPGGQKINKTSCAVQIKHIPTGIVVKSQETRSREQNRKYARQILAEKLDALENGAQSRTAIKTERIRAKKASANKKSKRKYKRLDEAKRAGKTVAEDVDESVDEVNEEDQVEKHTGISGEARDRV